MATVILKIQEQVGCIKGVLNKEENQD